MRFFSRTIFACAMGLLTSHGVLAADTATQAEPRYVLVAMNVDHEAQSAASTTLLLTGEPTFAIYTSNDQKIKIDYVVDYDAQGNGHIQTKTQSAAVDSDAWTVLSNFSATFIDGHEVFTSSKQADGSHFDLSFTIEETTSPTLAHNRHIEPNR